MLDSWVIEEIRKREKKTQIEQQIQLEVPQQNYDSSNEPKKDDEERGVYEIDIMGGD